MMAAWGGDVDELAGLRALIFDLDGTLYDSPALLAEYPRLGVEFAAARLGLPPEEVVRRFQQELDALLGKGGAASTTHVLIHLSGAELDEWGAYVAERVDPADYLDPRDYAWLRELLARLHRRYRQGIVSNNNRMLAERILALLGIRAHFDAILTVTESCRLKPDPTLYLDIAALLGVLPGECLSIGDRLAADIIPAEEAGLRGALVHGPADLPALGDGLLAAAEAREAAGQRR